MGFCFLFCFVWVGGSGFFFVCLFVFVGFFFFWGGGEVACLFGFVVGFLFCFLLLFGGIVGVLMSGWLAGGFFLGGGRVCLFGLVCFVFVFCVFLQGKEEKWEGVGGGGGREKGRNRQM